jgi:hypothetical protein
MLPFLVIEAKKEDSAVGFRAIQYQTAFPVRRLLKAQASLGDRDEPCEPCLVWFFAYQGEQWRLHVGTQDKDRVVNLTSLGLGQTMLMCEHQKIYDLWQGTIQSEDGALQLLLIVDYIWSWARDIYRPTIRRLILNGTTSFRDLSPASTDRFRHSVSLSCATSPAPDENDQDSMQIDEVAFNTESPGSSHLPNEAQQDEIMEYSAVQIPRSHSLLRWAVGHEGAPTWADLGSIRFSNVVRFKFRSCSSLAMENVQSVRGGIDESSVIDSLASCSIHIPLESLHELAAIWMTGTIPIRVPEDGKFVHATLLFQSYCDRTTWQIQRVLSCIIWGDKPSTPTYEPNGVQSLARVIRSDTSQRASRQDLTKAILDLRQIHGRDSVQYALREVSMALVLQPNCQSPKWELLEAFDMPEKALETLLGLQSSTNFGNYDIGCDVYDAGLWQVQDTFGKRQQLYSTLPVLEQDTLTGDSMLAIRSPTWPAGCPRFCLFILPGSIDDTVSTLSKLLEEAISLKNFFAEGSYHWSRPDWQVLWRWRKALEKAEPSSYHAVHDRDLQE